MTNMSRATPMVWNVSMQKTMKNSGDVGFFHDLKKQIRNERRNVPTSGTR
jgi:hypothetical protein